MSVIKTRRLFDDVFETYKSRYEDILTVLYPSKNSTGFTERNLSVNFATSYEMAHPGSVTWYEFQFGEKNNLHLDAVIVNKAKKEILLIESKRFKNATKQVAAVEKDILRIFFAKDECWEEFESRIDGFSNYDVYGVILADVWTETKPKTKIKDAFENSSFVSVYIENKLLAARLEEVSDVKHYIQKPKQLENYYLTSLVWKVHQAYDGKNIKNGTSHINGNKLGLEDITKEILLDVGVPAHIKGYQYLTEAIVIAAKAEDILDVAIEDLYRQVAKVYLTTSMRVERAIRHAVEVARDRAPDILPQYYGYENDPAKSVTNKEFIDLLAAKVHQIKLCEDAED